MKRRSAACAAKSRPLRREAGRHDRRPRPLHRQRIRGQAAQLVEFAVPIERRTALQQLGVDLEPFEPLVVAALRIDGDAVHVEFVLVPAAHDVEAGAAVRHMVDGGDRLGDEGRRRQGHMDGREQADALGHRADGGAVRHGLERAPEIVGFAAEAAPFRHRQDEIDAGLVRHDAGLDHVVPLASPAFRRLADGEAAVAIGIEQAELELVRAEDGVWHALHRSIPRGGHRRARAAVALALDHTTSAFCFTPKDGAGDRRCREESSPCRLR